MTTNTLTINHMLSVDEVIKLHTLNTLRFCRGNKTQTALYLKVTVKTLDSWLEKYEQEGKIADERAERERVERENTLRRLRGDISYVGSTKAAGPSVNEASAGVRVEPAEEAGPEHIVPVPERKEVQEVLPANAADGGQSKRSRPPQRTNGKARPNISHQGQ